MELRIKTNYSTANNSSHLLMRCQSSLVQFFSVSAPPHNKNKTIIIDYKHYQSCGVEKERRNKASVACKERCELLIEGCITRSQGIAVRLKEILFCDTTEI